MQVLVLTEPTYNYSTSILQQTIECWWFTHCSSDHTSSFLSYFTFFVCCYVFFPSFFHYGLIYRYIIPVDLSMYNFCVCAVAVWLIRSEAGWPWISGAAVHVRCSACAQLDIDPCAWGELASAPCRHQRHQCVERGREGVREHAQVRRHTNDCTSNSLHCISFFIVSKPSSSTSSSHPVCSMYDYNYDCEINVNSVPFFLLDFVFMRLW